MDIATLIGLAAGTMLIVGSILLGGGLGPFIDIPSVMITIGGAFSALLINFPMSSVLGMFGVVRNCFFDKVPEPQGVIEKFQELAAIARRDGLLAIENNLEGIQDSFMLRGLEMVAGGTEKEEIQAVLETEISYGLERHSKGKKIIDALGAAAPAFGMIGTLIGLVQMLRTLDDPSKIGVGMATALLTTLYGAVLANFICIPLAGKLENRSKQEVMVRELILMGVLSLVDGQAPRAIQERLVAFLAPQQRPQAKTQTAA